MAVSVGEEKFGRRVQVGPALVAAITVAAVVAWALVEVQFARGELLPPFMSEGAEVVGASIVMALWARPDAEPVAAQDRGT